jgi:hypothetical protein
MQQDVQCYSSIKFVELSTVLLAFHFSEQEIHLFRDSQFVLLLLLLLVVVSVKSTDHVEVACT